jgi:hypothetical protein
LCFAVFGGFAVRLDMALPSTFSLPCILRGLCRPEVFAVCFLHSLPCRHSLPCSFVPSDGKDFFAVRMAHGNDAPHGSAFFSRSATSHLLPVPNFLNDAET